jgi:hypothetical protein
MDERTTSSRRFILGHLYLFVMVMLIIHSHASPSKALEYEGWKITRFEFESLSSSQQKIYQYAVFDTIAYRMYSLGWLKALEWWNTCISENYNKGIAWNQGGRFGENLDKSMAFHYIALSEGICGKFDPSDFEGVKYPTLLLKGGHWEKFSSDLKVAYVDAYFDAIVALTFTWEEPMSEGELSEFYRVSRGVDVMQIVKKADAIRRESRQFPVVVSVAKALGAFR